jgi:hypothetical protein
VNVLPPLTAIDVARGVARLFALHDQYVMAEVPLPNGRRADLIAIDARGAISIVEVKVSRADLLGDGKWPDYCDYCDRFYWALAVGLDASPLDDPAYRPGESGLIIADRYDAVFVRPAADRPLAAARRKAETLRIARLAMRRMLAIGDGAPQLDG